MIVSAISLWKKYNLKSPLNTSEWGEEELPDRRHNHLSYSGHSVSDGSVRIYARFGKPAGAGKKPAVLFLHDVGKTPDKEVMDYFIDKGYAVLMPDYTGKMQSDGSNVMRTIYPASLDYGNYEKARGLDDFAGVESDKTTWVEWTYVALYSIKYLKSRSDISNIGIVGVRKGGEIAWQAMLSSDVKCGVPINAAGWRSFQHMSKFGENLAYNLSDDHHRYIAAVEAQSYAPYVKCPVLMLCSIRDKSFDCDRAYDTYSRIGNQDGNALVYSPDSGACIGPNGLVDMALFLEKNLKGREIYIPDPLNVSLKEAAEGIEIQVDCDKEGILEEAGIYYAEADVKTRSTYREWRCIYKTNGRELKNGRFTHTVKPFEGATAAFVYAYAKYINGFRVMSRITSKKFPKANANAVKSRWLFAESEMDCFSVAQYEDYSIGDIFLEREAVPKISVGYGEIKGAYSVGGMRTYKISSPRYIPDDNAFLEFDVYTKESQSIRVSIEVADVNMTDERYTCEVEIRGGGKWKRMILKASDFKGETYGVPLKSFKKGSALVFSCAGEEKEYAITNILWL